jgi:hypothetical protein
MELMELLTLTNGDEENTDEEKKEDKENKTSSIQRKGEERGPRRISAGRGEYDSPALALARLYQDAFSQLED